MKTLFELIIYLKEKNIMPESVIYLTGKECPYFFISQFLNRLRLNNIHITYCSTMNDDGDLVLLQSQLETTFLGTTTLFWLGFIADDIFGKKIQEILLKYNGPHQVICFISNDKIEKLIQYNKYIVNCDITSYDKNIQNLTISFCYQFVPSEVFYNTLFEYKIIITLDKVIMLAWYWMILGKNLRQFMQVWSLHIDCTQPSLFMLSQLFFAQKKQQFYELWFVIKNAFIPQFWISFWSEQIFRAYYVINLKENGNQLLAKQISYKLPFSFLQRDYLKVKSSILLILHNDLCNIDYHIKNGGSEYIIEIMYEKHFLH